MIFVAARLFYSLSILCNVSSFYMSGNKPEQVRSEFCLQNIGKSYNLTKFPNMVYQYSQRDAIKSLANFKPIVETKCSKNLAVFLCSVFIPFYSPSLKTTVRPCRSLCKEVKEKCRSVLIDLEISFTFTCKEYTEKNKDNACIGDEVYGEYRGIMRTGKLIF